MRRALAVLLLLSSCAKSEREPFAVERSALSAATKVLSLDGGPRVIPRAVILPLDGGVMLFDGEPSFIATPDGPTIELGDLQAGWISSNVNVGTPRYLVSGGRAWWLAASPNAEVQANTLWSSDGTFAGTRPAFDATMRVTELFGKTSLGFVLRVWLQGQDRLALSEGLDSPPRTFFDLGGGNGQVSEFLESPHGVVFLTNNELWRTDGTDAGVVRLTKTSGALRDAKPPLAVFANRVWFVSSDGSSTSSHLSSTDGTPTGTVVSPLDWNGVTGIDRTASDLVLVADDPVRYEPVAVFSDGTDAGTRIVIPSQTNNVLTRPRIFATTSTHAFFLANSSSSATGVLWGSNGTADGGVELAPVSPAMTTANLRVHLATSTRLYFTDSQGRPWVSDGTPAGTLQLSSTATNASGFVALDATRVVFGAQTPTTGVEPWVTDGSPAGTSMLKDLYPQGGSSVPSPNFLSNGTGVAWFLCFAPDASFQVCSTDGTPGGTRHASRVRGRFQLDRAYTLGRAGQRLLIQSQPAVLGWDRVNAPEALPMRFSAQASVEDPNGGAWLTDVGFNTQTRWWKTDGTAAGSFDVTLDAGVAGTPVALLATPAAAFLALDEPQRPSLYSWRPDAGLLKLTGTSVATFIRGYATWGDELVATAFLADAGRAIVATNGTGPDLRVVVAPAGAADLLGLTEFEGQLYFSYVGGPGTSLARVVADGGWEGLTPPSNVLRSRWVRAGRNLFALSTTGLHRFDPATSTLETLATVPVTSLSDTKVVGDGLLVVLRHPTQPVTVSVWASDGTVAGTRKLSGVFEGGSATTLVSAWGRSADDVFLPSWTRETGLEPAALGGGATSTASLGDLCAGPCSSMQPVEPAAIGDTLYVVGDDGANPALYAFDLNAPSPVGGGTGTGGGVATGGGTSGTGGGGATGGGTASSGGGTGEGGGGGMSAPTGCGCSSSMGGWPLALALLVVRRRRC